jgi:hypothetical protein
MPGVPGRGGPPPKRSTQRRRTNKPTTPITEAPGAPEVPVPPADERWHPIARSWYESLARSGQSAFYEPSDWATAVIIAESISRDLRAQPLVDAEGHAVLDVNGEPVMRRLPLRGASLSAYLRAMASLLTTEAERRRAHMELQRPPSAAPPAPTDDPDVLNLADFRGRLTG